MADLANYISLNEIIWPGLLVVIAIIFKSPLIRLSERVTKVDGKIDIDSIEFHLSLQEENNKFKKV